MIFVSNDPQSPLNATHAPCSLAVDVGRGRAGEAARVYRIDEAHTNPKGGWQAMRPLGPYPYP